MTGCRRIAAGAGRLCHHCPSVRGRPAPWAPRSASHSKCRKASSSTSVDRSCRATESASHSKGAAAARPRRQTRQRGQGRLRLGDAPLTRHVRPTSDLKRFGNTAAGPCRKNAPTTVQRPSFLQMLLAVVIRPLLALGRFPQKPGWGRLRKRKIKYVKPLAWPPLSQTIIFKKPP